MPHEVLKFGPKITALPIIHGSGDFAVQVRRMLLDESFSCVAVPLPPSFQEDVERAIMQLPTPTIVTQPEPTEFYVGWSPESEQEEPELPTLSYVPIDPCQGVISALRIALGEHIPRAWIDLETARYEPHTAVTPDPYALKKVSIERFAAALLPADSPGQSLSMEIYPLAAVLRA